MPDYSFIANPQTSSGLQSLSSIMNTANTALGMQQTQQNIQRGGIALQKEQALLQPEIAKGEAESQIAQTGAKRASWALQADQAAQGKQILGGLLSDSAIQKGDSEGSVFALMKAEDLAKAAGIPEATIKAHMAPLYMAAAHQPEALFPMLKQITSSNIAPAQQIANTFPAPQMANTGQVQVPLATGNQALTGVPAGTVQGAAIQNQLPPVTPVFDSRTNAPGYLGPTGGATGPVQSGPALGVTEAAGGLGATVAKDWESTAAAGKAAEQNIGVLQEIKKYAPGAATNVVADRMAFAAGLAGLIGMDAPQMMRTDTDLLAKNSNMLALAGGNTNLAKELASVANPNVHMTEAAITKAADQVIAQQRLLSVRAGYLQQFAGNPQAYTQAQTEFNRYADPRVLQYPSLSISERAEMKKAMNPAERADFANKLRFFQSKGMLQ